jgi:glutaminyl-peptide cyclotransferase
MEREQFPLRVIVPLLAVLALVAAGCGLDTGEAHLAPRTPLLPPVAEELGAPTALTPTTAAATPEPAEAPAPAPGTTEPPGAAGEDPAGDGEDAETGEDAQNGEAGDSPGGNPDEPQLLEIVVVRELLHSPTAFTQGLEISDGRLYESTGARDDRASTLRELNRETGDVLRLHEITDDVFAEGITFVDHRIYQITWKDGVALVWDPEPEEFTEVERFDYEGQGWGLCYNGRVLVMSDGSAELHFRDPVTFDRVGNPVLVTLDGEELPSLNELECVGETVWANVWQTDLIVQIEPVTGVVLALADASDIGQPRPDDLNAVLNGIAWDPDTETFLLTGKDWPAMYEVTFEAARTPEDAPDPANS